MMLGFQAAAARAGGRHTEGCPTTGTAQPRCLHQRVLWDFLSAQPCWLHADMALLPPPAAARHTGILMSWTTRSCHFRTALRNCVLHLHYLTSVPSGGF